jgi:hypothetical protein
MSEEPQQTLVELGSAFLERLRVEHDNAVAYAQRLAAAIEAAERIMPNLAGEPSLTALMATRSVFSASFQPSFPTERFESVARSRSGQVGLPLQNGGWARRLRDLTQYEALVQIAEDNEGIIRTSKARDILIQAGLTQSKPKNAYTNIHHLLSKSDEFEKIGEGVFRLISTSRYRPPFDNAVSAEGESDQ